MTSGSPLVREFGENLSPYAFVRIAETVPHPIYGARISFLADGLEMPFRNEHQRRQEYLDQCAEKKIAPFSFANFRRYSSYQVGESVWNSSSLGISPEFVAEGRRFGKVYLDGDLDIPLVKSFIKSNYQVSDGTLILTVFCGSGYNEGTRDDTFLTFDRSRIALNIGWRIEPTKVRELTTWFDALELADNQGHLFVKPL